VALTFQSAALFLKAQALSSWQRTDSNKAILNIYKGGGPIQTLTRLLFKASAIDIDTTDFMGEATIYIQLLLL